MLLLGRHMQPWKCMKILPYSYEIPDISARIIVHALKNCLIHGVDVERSATIEPPT